MKKLKTGKDTSVVTKERKEVVKASLDKPEKSFYYFIFFLGEF